MSRSGTADATLGTTKPGEPPAPPLTPGARKAAVGSSAAATAAAAMQAAFILIVVVSVGSFNEAILRAFAAPNIQQYVALVLWCVIVGASLFRPRTLRIAASNDAILLVGFYGFAAFSTLWSHQSPGSVEKGIALLVTTLGAYRLAVSMPVDDIVGGIVRGLLIICVVSVLLALFVPEIGLVQTWMHNGQWSGLFDSKQSLGTAGAFLMFFASYRVMNRKRGAGFLVTFATAATCVVASGSRGGGALAVAAIAGLYLSSKASTFARALALAPLVMMAAAAGLIAYLVASGNAFIPWFGERLDFTQRTVIWQYALRHFPDNAVLGFGLNGFWNISDISYVFSREHGWVLDNFHSGYIAVLVETGIVGATLFGLSYVFWTFKLIWLSANGFVRRAHFDLLVNFTGLSFLINFTETFFLRSTNIISTVLVLFFFIGCQEPGGRAPPRRVALS